MKIIVEITDGKVAMVRGTEKVEVEVVNYDRFDSWEATQQVSDKKAAEAPFLLYNGWEKRT
jgi:hypothetical protein